MSKAKFDHKKKKLVVMKNEELNLENQLQILEVMHKYRMEEIEAEKKGRAEIERLRHNSIKP